MRKPIVLPKQFTAYFLLIFSTKNQQWHIPETAPASGENFSS